MNRFNRVAATLLVLSLGFTGCKQSSPPDAATASRSAKDPTDAIGRAAADFLDAVLKGDSQRASARLTPQAMQRIIDSGMPFNPPGLATATFRIGQVRMPSPEQAIVQCVLTDAAEAESASSEEMCCLLRLVENDWRVSGIAYGAGPNQNWVLSNFETGQNVAIPREPTAPNSMGFAAGAEVGGRPSPPRTAHDAQPATVR